MPDGAQLSARMVASLLARLFGPGVYAAPPFADGPLAGARPDSWRRLLDVIAGPIPQPWQTVLLNPQPLPPRESYATGPLSQPWQTVLLNPQPLPPRESFALALADAHLGEILALDRLGGLFGESVGERALHQALRRVA